MTTKIKSGVIGDNVVGITQLNVSDGTNGQVLTTDGSGTLSFSTISGYTDSDVETYLNTSEVYTDATNNRLGIGTSSPEKILHIKTAVNNTAFVRLESTATDSYPTLSLKNDAREYQLTAHGPLGDKFTIYDGTAGAHRFVIDSSGNVGIGATTVDEKIHVEVSSGDAGLKLEDATSYMRIDQNSVGADTVLRFKTGSSLDERMRIDSATNGIYAMTSNAEKAGGILNASSATNSFRISADPDDLRSSSVLEFYVDSSERMRIGSNGAFKTKQGTSAYANATSAYNEICSDTGATANLLIRQGSNYYADVVNLWYYGGTPNDTNSNFLNAFDSTATRAKIYSNGGFANYQSNDSNLCDEREKKNIVASNSTWNDVKSWNIKKFHYNEDDDSDAKRYGVIAQDIEITNPDLIVDWEKQQSREEELWQEEDRPLPEGVSVGDVKTPAQAQVMRKAVKEQQMYIMAIKALQEAMTEIENLKSRIETLENA